MAVICNLSECDGNAIAIIMRVSKALRKAGVIKEEIDVYQAKAKGGDYDQLLQASVEILDDKGIEYE